jgi:hypothetical protein
MDDVTGDGLGDLLIGRQNYSPAPDRIGAGALTLIVGTPALRELAASLQPLDLQSPPANLTIVTFVGAQAFGRLGIWMRTGDVTGDVTTDTDGNVISAAIADIVVAADQAAVNPGQAHNGRAYLIRGGAHLAMSQIIDLANFGATPLAGHIIRIEPPEQADHYHMGSTCQIADLDGNGVGEVLLASALARNSASLLADGITDVSTAHSIGGKSHGALFIAWDNNFTEAEAWQPGTSFRITSSPGSHSIIHGGALNHHFGEEILGGLDYNNDGHADLFVGDIDADLSDLQTRLASGAAHIFYNAPMLMGVEFTMDAAPAEIVVSTFIGAESGDIAADTAVHGDFDGDGIADLAFSAPHGNPLGRSDAGIFYVFYGQDGAWPPRLDLLAPLPESVRMTYIYGAQGSSPDDSGDVLGYSADTGDFDGDGRPDLMANEMLGNGLGNAIDTGNLIVLSGQYLLQAQ